MRERGGLLSTISGLLTAAVILAIAAMIGVTLFDRQIREPGPLAADKVVVIPPRSGTSEIAEALSREGVISHTALFEWASRFSGKALKAGEYTFKAHASIGDTIETLSTGRQVQHAITFPEGLTSEQIVVRLNENDILTGDINEIPPEGSLLPDTYKFERGATRQQIVNLMRAKQREVLNQIWLRRSAEIPVKTPAEMVTLASIVEKETGRADERPRVAGVFVNRLNKRMKLQSDPHHRVRSGRRTRHARPWHPALGDRPGHALQHLRHRRAAAGADRQSGPRRARSRRQPVAHQGPLLRRRRHRRPRLRGQPGRPFAQRRPLAPGGARPQGGAHRPTAPVDKADPPADPSSVPGRASAYAPEGTNFAGGAPDPSAPRPKAFDASEGTKLDPLRNKTFDLNSAKSVPALKPQ